MNQQPLETVPYVAHEKKYPREIQGRFQSLRAVTVVLVLLVYYGLPWLNWQGHQAVLFDLPQRQFYIFHFIFWPQDFYYLTWLLIIAALSLFLITAIAGRLWCGYTCPQTVWTEVFLWVERCIEGNYRRQKRLDEGPWSGEKILKKTAKQFVWVFIALWTGFTFIGYFTPIRSLFSQPVGSWELFWGFFYSLATYGNAGFLREQVCQYMCPYARFQSAMFDRDTWVIAYNKVRGEPRKRRESMLAQGDCIDCQLCVQVCPTGIDIRNGLQYECIGCAACIDACDQVMEKIDRPKGLIAYTSEATMEIADQNGAEDKFLQWKSLLRPRVLIYTFIWLILVVGFLISMALRNPLAFDILRDRNALYQISEPGFVDNVYTLKIMNKDHRAYSIQVDVLEPQAVLMGLPETLFVAAGDVYNLVVRIRLPEQAIRQNPQSLKFQVSRSMDALDALKVVEETLFWSSSPTIHNTINVRDSK